MGGVLKLLLIGQLSFIPAATPRQPFREEVVVGPALALRGDLGEVDVERRALLEVPRDKTGSREDKGICIRQIVDLRLVRDEPSVVLIVGGNADGLRRLGIIQIDGRVLSKRPMTLTGITGDSLSQLALDDRALKAAYTSSVCMEGNLGRAFELDFVIGEIADRGPHFGIRLKDGGGGVIALTPIAVQVRIQIIPRTAGEVERAILIARGARGVERGRVPRGALPAGARPNLDRALAGDLQLGVGAVRGGEARTLLTLLRLRDKITRYSPRT